jgi:signal-transduction protein with cAMP-binding, CBS, and nucleotidyltransferase domain
MVSIEGILNAKGRTIYSVRPEAMVLEAAETMCSAHIGALLVLKRDCIAGIFSERDLLQRVVLSRLDPAHVEVSEVMTRRVVCTGGDVSPAEAMEVMTRECVRHLPVLYGRHVDGIVSMGDLVRWTIREREHAVEQLTEYVAGKYPG